MNLLIEKEMVRVSQSQNETVELERVFAKGVYIIIINQSFIHMIIKTSVFMA